LTAVSIDVDRQQKLAEQFQIQSVPTVLILSPKGRVLQRTTGYQSATQLLRTIQPFVRAARQFRTQSTDNVSRLPR
jgi:thioredoxin-like negative regulator of GroEL